MIIPLLLSVHINKNKALLKNVPWHFKRQYVKELFGTAFTVSTLILSSLICLQQRPIFSPHRCFYYFACFYRYHMQNRICAECLRLMYVLNPRENRICSSCLAYLARDLVFSIEVTKFTIWLKNFLDCKTEIITWFFFVL